MLKNISSNLFSNIVLIFIRIVQFGILLYYWDKDYFGEWLVLFTIPEYLALSDLGVGVVAVNEITALVAKKRKKEANIIFWNATYFQIIIFLIIFVSTFLFFNSNTLNFLLFNYLSEEEVFYGLMLLVPYVFFSMQLNLLCGIFRAEGNYHIGVYIINSIKLVEAILICVVAYFGYGILTVSLIYFSIHLICVLILFWVVLRRNTWLKFSRNSIALSKIKPIIHSSLAQFSIPLSFALTNQGIIILVGRYLGPSFVVTFSSIKIVVNFINQFVKIFQNAVWPILTIELAKGNFEKAKWYFYRTVKVSALLSMIVSIFILLLGNKILSIWTSGQVNLKSNFTLFFLLVFSNIFHILWTTNGVVLISVNKQQKYSLFFLLCSLIFLLSNFFLIEKIGLNIIGLSQLLLDAIMFLGITKLTLTYLNLSISSFVNELLTGYVILFREAVSRFSK